MKMKKFVLVFALLVSALSFAEDVKPRAVIDDGSTPAPVVVPVAPVTPIVTTPAAPQQPTVIVLQVPNAPTAPIVAPATPSPITAQQIEDALRSGIDRYKSAQVADPTKAWWQDLIQALIAAALSLAAAGIAWVGKKVHDVVEASKLAQADKDALEALSAGVTDAEQQLYADFAARNADGSIDAADAAALRTHALQVAKSVASGPGLNALEKMAMPRITDLIERIVGAKQAVQAQANPGVTVTTPPATATTTTVQTTPAKA